MDIHINYLFQKLYQEFLWRNKPSDELGNEFGHRYNVLTKKVKLQLEIIPHLGTCPY